MKAIIKITIAVVLGLGGFATYAQQAPMYTHYMYNTLMVNPAYAGSRDALTVTALHRSQWVSFEGAPKTQTITIHAPLRSQHLGVGLSASNDKIGPANNTSIIADFAYRFNLTTKSKLAFGLSGGANIIQTNLSDLNVDEQNDPAFQNNINNHITPSFGFGIYFSMERFYAGVSVPDLLESSYSEIQSNGSTLIGKEQRHYFFIAGAVLNLTDNLALKPTTLVKATVGAPIQADLTASFIIMKRLLIGAMYRTGDAVGGLVGVDVTNQLHLGYSFDYSYGLETFKYNQGSHEVVLRYDFIFPSKKQIHSPRHF